MDNFIYLPEITDNSSVIKKVKLHWLVKDEAKVNQGDKLMEVSTDAGATYAVVATKSGLLIRIIDKDVVIANPGSSYKKSDSSFKKLDINNSSKVCIGGIYDSYDDFLCSQFKFKEKVIVDSFTNNKDISWVYIAEPVIRSPYIIDKHSDSFDLLKLSKNDLNRKDVDMGTKAFRKVMQISDIYSKDISFSFVFSGGNSYIEFSYSQDKIKLKKNDSISFLFENGNISDFKLHNRPFRKNEQSQTRYARCQLYSEDIENLKSSLVTKWRISFADEQKPSITADFVPTKNYKDVFLTDIEYLKVLKAFSMCGDSWADRVKHDKRIPFLVQLYTKYYIEVLRKEVPDYEHPTKEYRGLSSENGSVSFDWCYVYLMKDVSNNYYKIGMSKTPEYRERTLQSEKPTIEMICNKRLPARKIAEAFEKALHTAFAEKRIRGEWFKLDDNDVMLLIETFK